MNTEAAIWLQEDAAYLYKAAEMYRERGRPADTWLASQVQDNAARSARKARIEMGIES